MRMPSPHSPLKKRYNLPAKIASFSLANCLFALYYDLVKHLCNIMHVEALILCANGFLKLCMLQSTYRE
jgi:hypothetical protein